MLFAKLRTQIGYRIARQLFNRRWAVANPRVWQWMQVRFARMSNYDDRDARAFYGHVLLHRGQGVGAKNEGLRLLMETDGIGGFDTRQIMPGIHLLENNQLAEHILSAKGPTASYIPAIMQACVQRMQDVCDLPLAGLQFEELDS